MSFTSKNIDLQRDLLDFTVREIFDRLKLSEFTKETETSSKLEACITQVVDSYLTFHSISNGNDVNLREICSDN